MIALNTRFNVPRQAPRSFARSTVVTKSFRVDYFNAADPGKSRVVNSKGDRGWRFDLRLDKDTVIPVTLGFKKSSELLVGRMAMLGVAFAVIGEIITGQGVLGQLNIETGVSIFDLNGAVIGLIIFNLFAALLPAKGKLVLPEERPAGSLQKKFFGFSGFGFTKENELFVGRIAQLSFAAMLLWEALLPGDMGPLGQLGFETGIPLYEAEPLLLFSIVFTLFAAFNQGKGKFVDEN